MAALDIAGISKLANNYQMDLRYLPYAVLAETLVNEHQISLLPGVENEDTITTFLRKGGIAKPLSVGMNIDDSDIGEFEESKLKIEDAYASVEDNIKRYKEKVIIRPGEQLGINQTKKHPFAVQLMAAMVITFCEDLLDAVFNAERNLLDKSRLAFLMVLKPSCWQQ